MHMQDTEDRDVRTMMQEALQKFNIKQVDVARETGVHHSTLSLWLQGKVRGHQIKIEETLTEWLNNLYSNKPRYTTLNKTANQQHHLCPSALSFKPKHDRVEQ
jgi:transcriptional regulator with XRE-family HTH domain